MNWTTVQRDFVERTLKVLEQYDEYRKKQQELEGFQELEVTLLVNCLTGLLVVPYEYANRDNNELGAVSICKGDTTALSDLSGDWGLGNMQFDSICDFKHQPIAYPYSASLRLFVYRMRNAVAHSRFQDGTQNFENGVGIVYQVADNPNKSRIDRLIFQDIKGRLKVTIPISDLRIFAEKFATTVLVGF